MRFRRERFAAGYPFDIPAIASLDVLELHPRVTFLTGENGSGKSTILEAIAVASGFNAEGGSNNFRFSNRASESSLHTALTLVRTTRRPRTKFFLRAESFFNLATEIEALDAAPGFGSPIIDSYGGRSLHGQSHGESFWSLLSQRLGPSGLYLFDEPESALSPRRQLAALGRIHELVRAGSQFVIAVLPDPARLSGRGHLRARRCLRTGRLRGQRGGTNLRGLPGRTAADATRSPGRLLMRVAPIRARA